MIHVGPSVPAVLSGLGRSREIAILGDPGYRHWTGTNLDAWNIPVSVEGDCLEEPGGGMRYICYNGNTYTLNAFNSASFPGNLITVVGKTYRYRIRVSGYVGGTCSFRLAQGANVMANVSADGTYEGLIVCGFAGYPSIYRGVAGIRSEMVVEEYSVWEQP